MNTTVDQAAVYLAGLEGTNPMAFIAGLGLLGVADRMLGRGAVRLGWRDGALPTAYATGVTAIDELVDAVIRDRDAWVASPALTFRDATDVKFDERGLRDYITACRHADDGGRSAALCAGLVAEGSFDNNGAAKPTDLHFAAGQQQFLGVANELLAGLTPNDVRHALSEEWVYASPLKSFGLDVTDDRVYALSASNPAKQAKRTVPGAEWLALMGIAMLPSFRGMTAGRARTVTTGCTGNWKAGIFTYPLWEPPLSASAAKSLVATAKVGESRSLPIHRFVRCRIRRSDQGGYGTFGPPESLRP